MNTSEQRIDIFGQLPPRRWHWYFLYVCWILYVSPLINLIYESVIIVCVRLELGRWPSTFADCRIYDHYLFAENMTGVIFLLTFYISPLLLFVLTSLLTVKPREFTSRITRWHWIGMALYWPAYALLYWHVKSDPFKFFYWFFD